MRRVLREDRLLDQAQTLIRILIDQSMKDCSIVGFGARYLKSITSFLVYVNFDFIAHQHKYSIDALEYLVSLEVKVVSMLV